MAPRRQIGSSRSEHLLHQIARQRQERSLRGGGIEEARELARNGNPLPLVGMQWPELLVEDEEEAQFFEGTIGDKLNPCLRADPWQREAWKAGFDPTVGEIFMKGCTGAGKGFTTGILLNLYYDVYDSCRIFITSETARHAKANLFGAEFSIRRLAMQYPKPGTLLKENLDGGKRHLVTVLNPSPHGGGEAFSGMHASDGETIYAFDEASACPEINYTNCLKNATKVIALSNPRITEGWFRDGYRPLQGEGSREERYERENVTGYCQGRLRRRYCITISGMHCTNVIHGLLKKPVAPRRGCTIGENEYGPGEAIPPADYEKVRARIPGQIDTDQYQSIVDASKEKWEVDCYAHAKFPSESPIRQAILYSWLDFHQKQHIKKPKFPVTCFGLDVARSKSGDSTVLSAGGIEGVRDIHSWVDDSNTRHVQKILKIAAECYGIDLRTSDACVCIEMGGGYGAAVYDRLQQLGVNVIAFDPAGSPSVYPNIYRNQRAEWYLLLGRRLDPSDNWQGIPWRLPPDEQLAEDLAAPVKIPMPNGVQYKLDTKDDIKKRLGRSPDRGDSVVCLWRAVFEMYNLVDRMSENQDNLIIASGYEEERSTDGEDSDLRELQNSKVEDIALPRPRLTGNNEDFVAEILDALGASQSSTDESDPASDLPDIEDEEFGYDDLEPEEAPDDKWSRYFED